MRPYYAMILLLPLSSFATSVASFQSRIGIDHRVPTEMKKFENKGEKLPDNYITSFPQQMLKKMFQDKRAFISGLKPDKACELRAEVTFLKSGDLFGKSSFPRVEQDAVDEFENGIIKIESVGCLSAHQGLPGMKKFNNTSFKLSTIAELKSSKLINGLTCEQTSVIGLGNSDYCYVSTTLDTEDENFLFTQNVTNAPTEIASATVFYRSTYTSFHEVGNETMTHTLAYVRGPKVPGLLRGIARSKILAAQKKGNQKLAEGL